MLAYDPRRAKEMLMGGQQTEGFMTVYQSFVDMIESGQLKPGDKLPTLKEIERSKTASHATITKAMALLRERKYIRTTTQGTWVHLAGSDRLFEILRETLDTLEALREQIQIEDGQGGPCIAGRTGGVFWDPAAGSWKRTAH